MSHYIAEEHDTEQPSDILRPKASDVKYLRDTHEIGIIEARRRATKTLLLRKIKEADGDVAELTRILKTVVTLLP